MIGQQRLLSSIDSENWVTSRFIILSAGRGAGKRQIAKHIAIRENAELVICGIKVEEVRDVIRLAHKMSSDIIFLFPRAHKMSMAAKNALLKVTEEAPRNSRFIMTVYDDHQVIATLRSRAQIIPLDPYTPDDLCEYAESRITGFTLEDADIIEKTCLTPGDVDALFKQGNPVDFYEHVKLALGAFKEVSPANALKISGKMDFKDSGEGWDHILYLRAFSVLCNAAVGESLDTLTAYQAVRDTTRFLGEMEINGINKESTFDLWILDMLEVFGNDPTS